MSNKYEIQEVQVNKFKKDYRLGVRLTEEQRGKMMFLAKRRNVKPSQVIRDLIDKVQVRK